MAYLKMLSCVSDGDAETLPIEFYTVERSGVVATGVYQTMGYIESPADISVVFQTEFDANRDYLQ